MKDESRLSKDDVVSLLSFIKIDEEGIHCTQWYKGIEEDLKEALEIAIKTVENTDIIS